MLTPSRAFSPACPVGRFGPLLSPDGEAGGAGTTTADKEAPGEKKDSTGGGEDGVRLTKEEFAKLTLASSERDGLKTKVEGLEKVRGHVQKLMRQDTPDEDKKASVTEVLRDGGYSQQQIDAYLKGIGLTGGGKKGESGKQREGGEDEGDGLREELQKTQDSMREQNRQFLQSKLDDAIEHSLDTHSEVQARFKDIKEQFKGTDAEKEAAVQNARSILQGEIENETKRIIRAEHERYGRVDPKGFGKMTQEATKATIKKFHSVIPASLGRSAETDSGEEEFLNSKPVEFPKAGKTKLADGLAQIEKAAEDTLTRAAMEAGRSASGNTSRV